MTLAEALAGKRIGVVLSAGYFGFYGHTGFVQGLAERGVQATAWAGTSAGGMVAAFAAAGLAPARIRELVLAQRAAGALLGPRLPRRRGGRGEAGAPGERAAQG